MKLGIDLCEFSPEHAGGKDEVAYNIIRGFVEKGHCEDIVCLCHKDLVPIIKKINSKLKTHIVPQSKRPCFIPRIVFRYFRGLYYKFKLPKLNFDVLLFTNKLSPFMKLPVKTVIIPHDMQFFEAENIPGLHYSKSYLKIMKWQITNDFKYRDHIIAISDFDKDEIIKFFPSIGNKVIRIYDPINFDRIKEQISNERKYITALNIQHPHKNCKTLIKAYALIKDQIPYKLLLVGKKPSNANKIEDYILANELEDKVSFTGFVNDEELARIIDETAIYVNPSYFEGFGMTAIEMMGRKIPTIVADNSASKETTLGLCKYYSPTGDSKALANSILDVINNPYTQEKLNLISSKVRQKYDFRKISDEYWNNLQNLK